MFTGPEGVALAGKVLIVKTLIHTIVPDGWEDLTSNRKLKRNV